PAQTVVQAGRAPLPLAPQLNEPALCHPSPIRPQRPHLTRKLPQHPINTGRPTIELCRHLLKLLRRNPNPHPRHIPSFGRQHRHLLSPEGDQGQTKVNRVSRQSQETSDLTDPAATNTDEPPRPQALPAALPAGQWGSPPQQSSTPVPRRPPCGGRCGSPAPARHPPCPRPPATVARRPPPQFNEPHRPQAFPAAVPA